MANHLIQPSVASSFSAARMPAAALMAVNDADTTKGSYAWSPPA